MLVYSSHQTVTMHYVLQSLLWPVATNPNWPHQILWCQQYDVTLFHCINATCLIEHLHGLHPGRAPWSCTWKTKIKIKKLKKLYIIKSLENWSFSAKISTFFHTANMFNFNSIMNSTSQSQNPNPCNPNYDDHQLSYTSDQLNNSPYFHIANYLMSDEDDGSKENVLLKNKDIFENNIDCSHGSSNSVPFARNM